MPSAASSSRLGRQDAANWTSGPWFFRSGRLFLVPGDSPIGYRLPLDSLPWVAPGEGPRVRETDPSVQMPPRPKQRYVRGGTATGSGGGIVEQQRPRRGESAP